MLSSAIVVALVVLTWSLTRPSPEPTPPPAFPADPGILAKVGVVLPRGDKGDWDGTAVEAPSVRRDPRTGRWLMAYAGYGRTTGGLRAQIGLARSTDGVRWTKYPTPILTPSFAKGTPDANGMSGPVLLREGGRYLLYYVGLTEAGYEAGRKTINLATATDPLGPWRRHGVVVAPAGDGWRKRAVWHVSVVESRGRWFMFFNATGRDHHEAIGYATAPSAAGPWTVDDANSPLLRPRAKGWDSTIVGDPAVRRVGDRWVMDYYGFDGYHAGDGIAGTAADEFPLGWAREGTRPLLAPSAHFDEAYAHKPYVVADDDRLLHYYTAVSRSRSREIALAVDGCTSTPAHLTLSPVVRGCPSRR